MRVMQFPCVASEHTCPALPAGGLFPASYSAVLHEAGMKMSHNGFSASDLCEYLHRNNTGLKKKKSPFNQ